MSKQIYLKAYCHQNLGDDLFIQMLSKRYSSTQFYLPLNPKFANGFSNIKNVHLVKENLLYRGINHLTKKIWHTALLKKLVINKVDGAVIIGGSMFIEKGAWGDSLRSYEEFQLKSKPLFILGSNFGPYHSRFFHEKYEAFFAQCTDVCFRDDYSKQQFPRLDNLRSSNDIVFNYPVTPMQKRKELTIIPIDFDRPNLWEHKYAYVQAIARIYKMAIKKGYIVNFLSFCKDQGDEKAIQEIQEEIENQNIPFKGNVVAYNGSNMEEMIHYINRAKFVLTTRFHGMILGWLCQCNVYPIIYDLKMENTIKKSKYQGSYSYFTDLESLEFETIYSNIYQLNIDSLITEAKTQFNKLDEFLENKNEKI